jgi:hypothetical protein
MAAQTSVATVEGPDGVAEIFELWRPGESMAYEVRFKGSTQTYKSLGEAYIEAGRSTGAKT